MTARGRARIGVAALLACALASCATLRGLEADLATVGETGYAEEAEYSQDDEMADDLAPAPADLSITELQELLIERGYEPGDADGDWGLRTQTAVFAFQADCELPATGQFDDTTRMALVAGC